MLCWKICILQVWFILSAVNNTLEGPPLLSDQSEELSLQSRKSAELQLQLNKSDELPLQHNKSSLQLNKSALQLDKSALQWNISAELPPQLGKSALQLGKSDCEINKVRCNNDTDCYHRLFYVHSTCIINGVCKPQCKMAILRLYESEYGRKLLHSDLSCIQAVKTELVDCDLSPEAETVHCTLARQICHASTDCHQHLDVYESQCESKLLNMHKCPKPCVDHLIAVFKTDGGRKMSSCKCWTDEDALCQHRKSHVLDPCNELALATLNRKKESKELLEQQIILNLIEEGDIVGLGGAATEQTSDYIVQTSNAATLISLGIIFASCHLFVMIL